MRKPRCRHLAALVLSLFIWSLLCPIAGYTSSLRISFLSPSDGTSLADAKLPITGRLSGAASPVTVQLLVNGTLYQKREVLPGKDGRADFSLTWETRGVSPGRCALALVLRTKAGEQASAHITVNLTGLGQKIDPLRIARPAEGAVLSGKMEVRLDGSLGEKSNVVLYLDGRVRAITNVPPFRFELDTAPMQQGPHTLQAKVFGSEGEVASSPVSTFFVPGAGIASAPGIQPSDAQPLVSRAPAGTSQAFSQGSKGLRESPQASLPREREQIISLAQTPPPVSSGQSVGPSAGEPSASPKGAGWEVGLTAGRPREATAREETVERPAPAVAATSSAPNQYCWLPGNLQKSITGSQQSRMGDEQTLSLTPALQARPSPPSGQSAAKTAAPSSPKAIVTEVRRPAEAASKGMRLHTVLKGDSLWAIARRYNTSVVSIAEANGLSDIGMIKIGQPLWIPAGATLLVNGRPVETRPGPFFQGSKMMLPLRTVVEACGGKVDWEARSRRACITVPHAKVVLGIGEARAVVNDQVVPLEAEVVLRAGRTFVSLGSLRQIAALPVRCELDKNRVEVARLPH